MLHGGSWDLGSVPEGARGAGDAHSMSPLELLKSLLAGNGRKSSSPVLNRLFGRKISSLIWCHRNRCCFFGGEKKKHQALELFGSSHQRLPEPNRRGDQEEGKSQEMENVPKLRFGGVFKRLHYS